MTPSNSPWPLISPHPARALPAGSTLQYQHHAIRLPVSFESIIPLHQSPPPSSRPAPLTHLIVVHKVEHWHDVQEDARVPRVARRDALHVVRELRLAVQRLALLDLVNHLPHVHIDLALVLRQAVETHRVRAGDASVCCEYDNDVSADTSIALAETSVPDGEISRGVMTYVSTVDRSI